MITYNNLTRLLSSYNALREYLYRLESKILEIFESQIRLTKNETN